MIDKSTLDPEVFMMDLLADHEKDAAAALARLQLLFIDDELLAARIVYLDWLANQAGRALPPVDDLSREMDLICNVGLGELHKTGMLTPQLLERLHLLSCDPKALRTVHERLLRVPEQPRIFTRLSVERWRPWIKLTAGIAAAVLVGIGIWVIIQHSRRSEEPRLVMKLLDDNAVVGLDRDNNLHGLEELPAELQQDVKNALISRELRKPPVLENVIDAHGVPRGEPRTGLPFVLISPVGTVIATEQPTFQWHALDGAEHYEVTIVAPDGERIRSGNIDPDIGTSVVTWKVPAATKLQSGAVYEWQVTAVKGVQRITSPQKPDAPEARFKIIEYEKQIQLNDFKRREKSSHLALAILYAREGMMDEAEVEMKELLRLNRPDPGAEELVQQLLKSVEEMRPIDTR